MDPENIDLTNPYDVPAQDGDDGVSDEPEHDGGGDDIGDEVREQAQGFVGKEEEEPAEEEKPAKKKDESKGESLRAKEREGKSEEEGPKKGSRAEERIRKLSKELKDAHEHRSRTEQEFASMRQQVAQLSQQSQQQLAEAQKRAAVLERELELIRQQRDLADEEKLDPVEKFKRATLREALAASEKKLMPQLQAERQERLKLMQNLQAQQERAASEGRIRQYSAWTDEAIHGFMEKHEPAAVQKNFERVKTQVLNYAAAGGYDPSPQGIGQAAEAWRRLAYDFVLADMKARSRASAEKRKAGEGVPQGLTSARRPGNGKGKITMEQARKMGFSTPFEARAALEEQKWGNRG